MDWLRNNAEWLFDGFGASIAMLAIAFFLRVVGKIWRRKKDSIIESQSDSAKSQAAPTQIVNTGHSSKTIQAGGNVTIHVGGKDEK